MKSFVLPLLALALVACAKSEASPATSPSASAPAAPPVAVDTAPATKGEVATWLPLTGQLRGLREADLAANAYGKVVSTSVERGTKVKQGQTLAILDTRTATLSAKEARIALENVKVASAASRRDCERSRALFAQGAISKAEAERYDAQCEGSELTIAAAETRSVMAAQTASDGVIRAPFAGVVAERFVEIGEYVRADSPVVSLVDASSLRLELTVPETSIARVREGAAVRFTVKGYPEARFTGRITHVSGAVRAATRDVVAEALIDNAEGLLKAGMFAAAELESGVREATLIPATAVADRDGKTTVFVVKDGRAEQRIVERGEGKDAATVAVLRGVEGGDEVVVSPPPELRNGARVD